MPDVFHGVFCDVILRFSQSLKHLQLIEGHVVIKASINLPLEYLNYFYLEPCTVVKAPSVFSCRNQLVTLVDLPLICITFTDEIPP